MVVQWVGVAKHLVRLEGFQDQIDSFLRSLENGDTIADIEERAEDTYLDVEVHP